jgi:hypothetical protein
VAVSGPRWALPRIESDPATGTESFVLVANPTQTAATVTFTVVGGLTATRTVALAASSRTTLPAAGLLNGTGSTTGALRIESDGPDIVVEHASYTNAGGQLWGAGSAALATRLP